MRTLKRYPRRDRRAIGKLEIDEESLEWMRTHTIEDLANAAIMKAANGEDATPAFKLLEDITEIAWRAGAISEPTEHLIPLEYYSIPEHGEQTAEA
ncbi:MAG: hypothetical protein J7L61_04660 [Thermoplasmata archaeon]|nr:hypothetical protein [Thermoplasmata archaeon]